LHLEVSATLALVLRKCSFRVFNLEVAIEEV
jgi:hypothetical protein